MLVLLVLPAGGTSPTSHTRTGAWQSSSSLSGSRQQQQQRHQQHSGSSTSSYRHMELRTPAAFSLAASRSGSWLCLIVLSCSHVSV